MSETEKVPARFVFPGNRLRVEFEGKETTEWTVAAVSEREDVFTKRLIALQAEGETPRTILVDIDEDLEVIR